MGSKFKKSLENLHKSSQIKEFDNTAENSVKTLEWRCISTEKRQQIIDEPRLIWTNITNTWNKLLKTLKFVREYN